MLCIKDSIAAHRRLATIARRIGGREIFRQTIASGFPQLKAALSLRVPLRHIVDFNMKEMVADQLTLQRFEGMGGIAEITHTAVADAGELEVALMRRGGPLRLLADGFRLLRKRHPRSPNVRYARARSVDIATPGIPLQVDGEPAGAKLQVQ